MDVSTMSMREIRQRLASLMDKHGFEDGPLWWTRVGPNGERQALRTVLWGLQSKPNPHLGVEVVPEATEEWMQRRNAATEEDLLATMVLHRIPLTQSWDQVEAAFDTEVLALFDSEIVVESDSGETLTFPDRSTAEQHALNND